MIRVAPVALATAFLFAGAAFADANAYSRSSKTTGAYGRTVSSQGSGSCAGGKCSSQQSATGPRGYTATRQGSTSCSGGKCTGGATYTGPAGNTATRSRSTTF